MKQESGPIYGVQLIDSLPIGNQMTQAMPSRLDLERAATRHGRVVAGYEVLLAHYREKCDELEELKCNLFFGDRNNDARANA